MGVTPVSLEDLKVPLDVKTDAEKLAYFGTELQKSTDEFNSNPSHQWETAKLAKHLAYSRELAKLEEKTYTGPYGDLHG